jgi:phosphinothricin acetyltransferase
MESVYAAPTIRPGAPGDLEAIRAVRNDAIATTTAIWTSVQQTSAEATAWLAEHLARGSILVAELDQEVLGFACWGPWRAKEGYALTVEDSIYLAEGYGGRGIGRLLLQALIDSARAAGKHVMIADIEAGNAASIALHQRLGFEMVGTLPQVGTKFGRWLDLTILQLAL